MEHGALLCMCSIFSFKFSFLVMHFNNNESVPVGGVCDAEILAIMLDFCTIFLVFLSCLRPSVGVFSKGSHFG